MRVAYDLSVLGAGLYSHGARTGVARVVDNLRLALLQETDVDLAYCVSHSLEQYVQLYTNPKAYDCLDPRDLYPPKSHFVKLITEVVAKGYPQYPLVQSNQVSLHVFDLFLKIIGQLWGGHTLSDMTNVDIFHSPFFPFPESVQGPQKFKRFINIHDLIPILFPHFFSGENTKMVHQIVASIEPDDWVLANSESTKNDFCDYTKIDPSRVFVTPLAASRLFSPDNDPPRSFAVRKRYGIPEGSYVLSVSTLEPRKNIDLVIRSFIQLIKEQHIGDLSLVLVGAKGWDFDEIFSEISQSSKLRDRIVVTGYVPDSDLPVLYSGAMMFVYPSFYEGFGLPPLEAMQCGVPVITSNTSSLPEVVGDAGLMVAPIDSDGLSQAMFDVFSQPILRNSLSSKSLLRAKQFSWQKCANLTLEAYKMALSS